MKILYKISLITLALAAFSSAAFAQSNPSTVVFLTWHATTYTPSDYAGKSLLTTGSKISFSVEAVSNNQLISLKDKTVRWYEQGRLSKSGLGMQTFDTQANILPGNDFKVRVEIPDLPEGSVSKTVTIRIVKPKVVVEAPFPKLQVPLKDFSVKATPYFFSVLTQGSLTYQWFVSGQALSGEGDPQTVSVSAKTLTQLSDRNLIFKAIAQNPNTYIDKGEGEKTVAIR